MNHETTTKRIQLLVPEVMALEEGCRVVCVSESLKQEHQLNGKGLVVSETHVLFLGSENVLDRLFVFYHPSFFTILGKPITLSVVLLAMSKNRKQGNHKYVVTVSEDGFMENTDMKNYNRVQWNLSKDNFNDQTDETKNFIGELLNKYI